MDDLISRQAAIDFIDAGHLCNPNEPRWSDNEVVNFLKSRPPAQPEKMQLFGESTTKDSTFDCISRQAVLDAVRNIRAIKGTADDEILLIDKAEVQTELMCLPTAQPEIIRCEDCMHNGSFDTDCPIDWNGKEYCSFAERRQDD